MNLEKYLKRVQRTRNTEPLEIDPSKVELLNYCLGLAGEVGEFVNLVKKYIFHKHPITRERFMDEIGDIIWYLFAIAFILGLDISEILAYNIKKLEERFPEGFSSEASQNRKRS